VPRLRQIVPHDLSGHFVRMQWQDGECSPVEEIWVDRNGRVVDAFAADLAKAQ
jgi:hypothetical protein